MIALSFWSPSPRPSSRSSLPSAARANGVDPERVGETDAVVGVLMPQPGSAVHGQHRSRAGRRLSGRGREARTGVDQLRGSARSGARAAGCEGEPVTAKLLDNSIVSLDGFVADADGSFGWTAPDDQVHRFVNDLARDRQRGRRPAAVDPGLRETVAAGRQGRLLPDAANRVQCQDADRAGLRPTSDTCSSSPSWCEEAHPLSPVRFG